MLKMFKLKKLNKAGAGMVTVIIAIALISVLSTTLLSISYMNYKMKVTNTIAKENFYSAETALDEVNMGLQTILSDAISSAYADVMSNYSSYNTDKKNAYMEDLYYRAIYSVLADNATYSKYKVSVLNGFLKTMAWDDSLGYGCFVTAADGNNDMVTYTKNGIVLKNVTVYCKNQKGYTSSITTDIRLSCPSIDFGSVTALPDIMEYVAIADNGMKVYSANGRTTTVKGSVYTQKLSIEGTGNTSKVDFTNLTDVATGDDINNMIISKENVDISKADVVFNASSEIWTNDINMTTTKLSLKGAEYLADDINILGSNSELYVSKNLYAYGTSMTEANKSSAILVNGSNAKIDFTGSEIVMIGGHAFVTTGSHNAELNGVTSTAKDVYTGESISVKSNQLMYLVPAECIGIVDGVSLYGQNPMTADQYTSMMSWVNTNHATEIDTGMIVGRINDKLDNYIAFSDTVDENGHKVPLVEKVFVQTNGHTMVYYYMTFQDEDKANRYFKAYYNNNADIFTKYMKFYTNLLEIPDPTAMVRLQTAGNLLEFDGSNSTLLGNTVDGASSRLNAISHQYSKEFSSLCIKLMKDEVDTSNAKYTEITDALRHIVFDNIVDVDKLKNDCLSAPAGTIKFYDEDNITLMMNNAGSTYEFLPANTDKDKIHCIVATGDVYIKTDFTGIIIADGEVKVAEGVTITADTELASMAMRLTDDDSNSFYQYLRDGESITSSGTGASGMVRLSDLIVYENWNKK